MTDAGAISIAWGLLIGLGAIGANFLIRVGVAMMPLFANPLSG
jgi:hypothetical protein